VLRFGFLCFLGFKGLAGKPPHRRGETDTEAIESREDHAEYDQQKMQQEGTVLRYAQGGSPWTHSIPPGAAVRSQDKFSSETDRQDILTGTR